MTALKVGDDVRQVPGAPMRLFDPRVCLNCRTWMRRGTHIVFLADGKTAHASPATCKAAVRRRTTREAALSVALAALTRPTVPDDVQSPMSRYRDLNASAPDSGSSRTRHQTS